jgi:hypothetical protein
MAAQPLSEIVATLDPREEAAVREFIDYLKRQKEPLSGSGR